MKIYHKLGIAGLAATVASCGDTYNYSFGSSEGDQKNETYTCETAIANTWDCGLYEDDGDYGDPDFYQDLIDECYQLTSGFEARAERDPSFLPTLEKWFKLLECESTSSCSEMRDNCAKYSVNY